ncbi:IclR family transcriptional regulator [Dermabacteraceae bacterium P13147]
MAQAPAPIEAIDRALRILEELGQAGSQGYFLADLAGRLDLNKSTVYRALNTLRQRNFVHQDAENGRYSLGPAAVNLGLAFFDVSNLPALLHPTLLQLSDSLNELVHLGVPFSAEVLYIDKVEPARAIQVRSRTGQTIPAASSAMGRALLAYRVSGPEQLSPYIAAQHARADITGGPKVTPQRLWEAVSFAKSEGYASEIEENEAGVSCVGVPVLREGKAIAAISVTGLSEQMDAARIKEIRSEILRVVPAALPLGLTIPTP